MTADLKQTLRTEALALGFASLRVTTPDAIGDAERHLVEFLEAGRHGDMAWMATTAERRGHPRTLWPRRALDRHARHELRAARSIRWRRSTIATRGVISVYAQGKDYHDILKAKLKQLAGSLATASGAEVKVFVDTAPLMEKPLAAAAGIGWQGKHTNLVSREHGSWLFLGAILTSAEIEPDAPEADHCGTLQPLPRRLPDARVPGALPARCAPLPRLPVDRAQGAHPGRVPPAHGQPRVRLRRLPRRVPVEQVRGSGARERALRRGPATDNPPLAELLTLDDRVFPRPLRRHADQAHGPRPLPAQRADRRRQLGR